MRRRLRDGRDGRALVEELERIGEALPGAPEKSHWFLELGVACEMLVPERLRALQLYARAVDLDPATTEAIDRGRMVSRELGRIDEFIRLTEIDLAHEPDDERRERLATLIGEALLDLGDRQRAAAFLVRAAGQFPSSLAIQDALGTVGYDDAWQTEVDRLVAIGENAEDADAGARVSLRAARILRMEAPEDERYEWLLQRTLYYDPYNESAHQLLDGLYATAGRWEDLEELERQLVAAFPGADEQAALCQRFSFGWIARGQHDRAAAWCWRAIELGRLVYPIAGLTMLRGLYASRRDWDRLLQAVDALLATPLDEDAEVHTSLLGGTIAWKAKADLARAGVYFERVRRVALDSPLVVDFDDALADKRNPETLGDEQRALIDAAKRVGKTESIERSIDAWKKAVAADPSKRAPRRALARVLYRSERWRTLADALKDEEAHACRDDGERVALLFQLVALYRDRLRQDLLLTSTLQRILELQPGNLAALDQLEQALAGMRRWPEVAATIARKLPHVADPKERVELQLKLAEVWQEKLGNEVEAVKALAEALALEPTHPGLAERLERAYTKRREWDKLFALKQTQLGTLADPAARLAAQLELAQLATEKLKKPALAVDAFREVLAIDGDHEGALAALERLYQATQAHAALADIYARRAAQPGDAATQLGYLTKLAQLCSGELDDAARAIETWRKVLALQPTHLRAREMLRRLYVARQAWDELQALFADEERLDECARLFERQAVESAGELQLELWLRAARLWRTPLERRDLAQRAFERALALAPAHVEAIAALAALYEESGEHRKLAGVLALQIEQPGDPATQKARRLRLAALHGRELRDAAAAFRWQLEAFTLDPTDAAVRGEVELLATRASAWPELIEIYERIATDRDDVERVILLSTVARQKEAVLGDVDGALATWRALAAAEPPLPEALQALVRIYESRSAWRELHDVYLRKLELCHGSDERRPIVVAMAALAERQGDDGRAIVAYRRLADELGADDVTLEALERLHERQGDLAAVDAVLLERLMLPSATTQRAQRIALTFRLAEVRRRRELLPEAIALYGEVLEDTPNHAGARAGLQAIADGGGPHRLAAALLLEPILRATGDAAHLAGIIAIRVEHAADPAEAVALLHELAWLFERELGRRDDALETLARALRADPAHQPTFDALEKLTGDGGDWERVAALYKEIARRPLSIPEHVEVRCRLGALYRDRTKDAERALRTFERVLDLAPDNAVADQAIDALLAAAGRHAERAARLAEAVARRPDGDEERDKALRLAALYEHDLGQPGAAIDAYAAILARDPHATAALSGLERLFAAGVERQRVASLLMPSYRESGRAADLARIWMAALVESPDGQPLDELTALARSAGQLDALAQSFARAVERAETAATRATLRLALAGLERERGATAAAEALLRRVLADEPEHKEALRALDSLLAAAGRHADRIEPLGRLAAVEEPEARRALCLTLAELQERTLGDAAGARATLEGALALGDEPRLLRALARLSDDEPAMELWKRLRAVLPDDAEALTELAALYDRHDRFAELAGVLERQLATASAEAAPALVERQALVLARLGDRAAAEAAWRRLTALTPRAPEPWRAIARLCTSGERWSELAEVLERLVELEATPAATAATAAQLARLEAGTLERPERAIAAWQRVLAADPRHDEAPGALAALYARTGRADERRRVIEEHAEAAERDRRPDAAALLAEAAALAVDEGDGARATRFYERVVALEPQHPIAQAYLEASHRERGEWRALVTLLRARAARLPAAERGELLAEVAAVEERELGDRGAGFSALLDAFEADGRWAVHGDDLRRLAAALDGWPLLSATLQRRAAAGSAAERQELYLELGSVLEAARQLPAALEAYRALLALDPGYVPALERLERIYRDSGQPALLEVLERRAELAGDRDDKLRLYQSLADEAARLERWARAIDAHRRSAALEPEADARGQQLYRAGVIYRDHLADADEALDCFQAAADSYAAGGATPPAALAEAIERLRALGKRAVGRT